MFSFILSLYVIRWPYDAFIIPLIWFHSETSFVLFVVQGTIIFHRRSLIYRITRLSAWTCRQNSVHI